MNPRTNEVYNEKEQHGYGPGDSVEPNHFFLTVAPLAVEGGTGSPVNPLATS